MDMDEMNTAQRRIPNRKFLWNFNLPLRGKSSYFYFILNLLLLLLSLVLKEFLLVISTIY